MKKIIVLFLLGCCTFPVWAQKGHRPTPAKSKVSVSSTRRTKRNPQKPHDRTSNNYLRGKTQRALASQIEIRQQTRLANFPDQSPISIYTPQIRLLSARALLPDELQTLFRLSKQITMPNHFQVNDQTLYRGMVINQLSDLKNLLQNGLETRQTYHPGEIWTSPYPGVAFDYAIPNAWNHWQEEVQTGLPVLVRISLTPPLLAKNPPDIFWQNRVFFRDIPARYMPDVMVFLEVNGQRGWYKATLENEEVALIPVDHQEVNANNYTVEVSNPNAGSSAKVRRITPDDTPVSSTGEVFQVLPDDALRARISNDDEMQLFIPQSFAQRDNVLYRGLRLHNTEELKNILTRGMETDKTHHHIIYVSPNVSVALEYVFPHQTARLLGTDTSEALPVLVKIPVTPRLLKENPPTKLPEDFGGRRVFYNDIRPDEISEVAVFITVDNVSGWYLVTWENGQLVFTPAPLETIRGWISR